MFLGRISSKIDSKNPQQTPAHINMTNAFLLTIAETALELDCSTSTINRLTKQKHLHKVYLTPGKQRGGCPRITRESIDDYLAGLSKKTYSRQCIEASATQRSSAWPKSTHEKTRRITGAGGSDQTAHELGKKLGVL
jgi:hypothetical protein